MFEGAHERMHEDVHVGVDGGGTRARAVVLSGDGSELARVTGDAGLIDPRDPALSAHAVTRLVRTALDAAQAHEPAVGLCCGLAGAGRQEGRETVRAALLDAGLAEHVLVTSDAEVAMADAFGSGPGVLVIAGTGSIAWARSAGGASFRVGGRGALLDDGGSGYAIGLAALRAVVLAADGRASPTALSAALFQATGCADMDALTGWAAAADKAAIAALAPTVLATADGGDAIATALCGDAVDRIVELAVHAADRAGLVQPSVALAGGLIEPRGPLRAAVVDRIQSTVPGTSVIERVVDAALGAARMSLQQAGQAGR